MGRVETEKWGPRIIDLDLLVYRDRDVNEPDLDPAASAHRRAARSCWRR